MPKRLGTADLEDMFGDNMTFFCGDRDDSGALDRQITQAWNEASHLQVFAQLWVVTCHVTLSKSHDISLGSDFGCEVEVVT